MPSIRVGETFSCLHFGQNDVDLSIYILTSMQAQPHLIAPYARHELNLDLRIYTISVQVEEIRER